MIEINVQNGTNNINESSVSLKVKKLISKHLREPNYAIQEGSHIT